MFRTRGLIVLITAAVAGVAIVALTADATATTSPAAGPVQVDLVVSAFASRKHFTDRCVVRLISAVCGLWCHGVEHVPLSGRLDESQFGRQLAVG